MPRVQPTQTKQGRLAVPQDFDVLPILPDIRMTTNPLRNYFIEKPKALKPNLAIAHILLVFTALFQSSILPSAAAPLVVLSQQQQKDPEPSMEKIMEGMLPMMRALMTSMMQIQFEFLAEPKTGAQLAAFSRNYFDELVRLGFSRKEAFQLLLRMGMPSLPTFSSKSD